MLDYPTAGQLLETTKELVRIYVIIAVFKHMYHSVLLCVSGHRNFIQSSSYSKHTLGVLPVFKHLVKKYSD